MARPRFNTEPKALIPLAASIAIGGAVSLYQARRARRAEGRTRIAEATEEHLRYLATHDELTGELNRQGLRRLLDDRKPPRAMLYVDGTNQKAINDKFGHKRGDEVIVGTADVLRASLRPGDTMARIGGDEFLVVLDTEQREITTPLSPDEVLEPVTSRIYERTREFIAANPDLQETGFDIAVGGVVWRQGMTITDMETGAEAAMYQVKAVQHETNGKHR